MSNYASPPSGGLQYSIEHGSSFALAVLQLPPEQPIKAEAGAMVSMSPNIELTSKAEGGLVGIVKRAFVGESAFINTFTAHGGVGELTLAPSVPGDIIPLELYNQAYLVQSGSFLAATPGVELDLKFGGAKAFFAGEGLFLIKLSGSGLALISSFGAIRHRQLAPGERYIVDTSHIVAFDAHMPYTVRKASQQGYFRSFISGEGLVCEYVGPGNLFMQTRNLSSFASMLRSATGSKSSSSAVTDLFS
jgi:uncharacterized protein (TIGR00266 family)